MLSQGREIDPVTYCPPKKARMINLYFFLYGENEEEHSRKMDFSLAYTASPTAHIQEGQGELC